MKENFDIEYFLCDVFVGLQKLFDVVDHKIFLAKRQPYGEYETRKLPAEIFPCKSETICIY